VLKVQNRKKKNYTMTLVAYSIYFFFELHDIVLTGELMFWTDGHFSYTGCLIKNASTHNFFICYSISMNKKPKDMVFMRYEAAIKKIFLALFSIAYYKIFV
jgi:hypothetical protein